MNWQRRPSASYELLQLPLASPTARIRTWSDSIAETATAEGTQQSINIDSLSFSLFLTHYTTYTHTHTHCAYCSSTAHFILPAFSFAFKRSSEWNEVSNRTKLLIFFSIPFLVCRCFARSMHSDQFAIIGFVFSGTQKLPSSSSTSTVSLYHRF